MENLNELSLTQLKENDLKEINGGCTESWLGICIDGVAAKFVGFFEAIGRAYMKGSQEVSKPAIHSM